ncbi:MAG: hypothetical protein IPK63_10485 [Candidatus Competibacteraceae bacterium]|nr:hypothetical protein [Candidatus Competibacteraceae bacterium]
MKIIYLLTISIIFGCASNVEDIENSRLGKDFYRKNIAISDQMKEIKSFSINEQYEIFEFGNRVIYPPASYLALSLAEQGEIIIPFLRDKLENTNDELTIRDIILIFSEMVELKNYEFSKDLRLRKLIRQKVDNMKGIWYLAV